MPTFIYYRLYRFVGIYIYFKKMDGYTQETSAPFNMAIATLMSLRQTLDSIRNIEGRIDYPAEERQRIKIELVKRFFVDSCPLLFKKEVIDKFREVLDIIPVSVIKGKSKRKVIKYSYELNKTLDCHLLNIQVELQKNKYYMPPAQDMGSIVGKMH